MAFFCLGISIFFMPLNNRFFNKFIHANALASRTICKNKGTQTLLQWQD
ncbi:hypothetical protein MNB_SUP05-SYMBIONT-5-909 [hydrothermal vent metagenome]|uniref:Uncharacterized protein n=1 Tax=hydrothermal vent metagenome TaxID=652676 RepID=A0A1W1E1L6_9ZZZZ